MTSRAACAGVRAAHKNGVGEKIPARLVLIRSLSANEISALDQRWSRLYEHKMATSYSTSRTATRVLTPTSFLRHSLTRARAGPQGADNLRPGIGGKIRRNQSAKGCERIPVAERA